jgi:hypothetical protein
MRSSAAAKIGSLGNARSRSTRAGAFFSTGIGRWMGARSTTIFSSDLAAFTVGHRRTFTIAKSRSTTLPTPIARNGKRADANSGSRIEYNWSHDNHGDGVWMDSNNDNFHCHHNLVENNWAGGIAHVIGWSASIHTGGLEGRLIEIFNNILVSNYRGRGSDGVASAKWQRDYNCRTTTNKFALAQRRPFSCSQHQIRSQSIHRRGAINLLVERHRTRFYGMAGACVRYKWDIWLGAPYELLR